MKSTDSTKRRFSWTVSTMTSLHSEMMSFAPPEPGSRTLGRQYSRPMTLEFRFPYRSIWAPPMKPQSRNPRCAKRKVSVMPGSIVARRAARISLVEIGSRPGAICGPTMPPSITIVSRGA